MSVVHYVGNVFYLCGAGKPALHIDESVFTESLSGNVVVSMKRGRWTALIHSFRLWVRGYSILCFLISI